MKKVIPAMVFLFAAFTAMAQHTEFGIKGGLNLATLNNDFGDDYKLRTGFHAGFLAHIHLNKTFAIQPELVYSGQGMKYNGGNNDLRYDLGYLNIPVLLQLMTSSGFRFETGPQLGFLLSGSSKTGNNSTDVKGYFKSTDVSWAFGIGYITTSKFGFDVRYNLGVTDVSKDNSTSLKNSVLQAGVFYQFK